ncbi:uncharacterized protein PV06_10635 [Exophiala oligosperma]|uniref:Uncharacterized protein n=1 Tax=Exophiala oligosperma TaxID=215243 RepID=A0A0D2D4N3_9EURO|nr:uncharacterized protein PV06_10635 [Exophiala oligosperma]KIW37295.1 hypothetical protein PV06_10635 [Exophiala oligosperma]
MDLAGSVEARYLEPPGEVLPIMAGYFPEHCLTLSLVDQNILFVRGVRDVRPIKVKNILISHQDGTDRIIEIKQIGILNIQYEDVGTGKRGSESLECGILPSTSQPPYHIILSTADTVTIFPQAIPIGRMAIYRPDAQETCGVCGRTGATVTHGECNQWFHTTCGRDSQPGSSKLPVGLIGTHELCSIELCRKSITHLPRLRDPAITFKARRAGEASSSTEEAQFATKDYVTQFYSPDETVIRVWGMFPQRGWVRVRSPHSGVKDVFSRLVGQDTEKKLKKLGFREWKGERAQEFRDAEYDALREVTVRAPSIAGVLVPKPVGAGSYQDGKDTVCFFSITQFLPSQQVQFEGQVKRLVDFHGTEQSQGDRFGFSHPTLFYDQPLNVGWHNSWLDCFLALMKLTVSQDKDRHGP